MGTRDKVAAVGLALLMTAGLASGASGAEGGGEAIREGVRLPILGPGREPVDLLRQRPEEVERLLERRVGGGDPLTPQLSPLPWLPSAQGAAPSGATAGGPEPARQGGEAAAEAVSVERIWVAASAPGQGTVSGEAALANRAGQGHRLVAVHTDAAEEVILHTTFRAGTGARHTRALRTLYLPAGERVQLRPGGPQLRLIGLRRPLSQGEAISVVLRFDDGSRKRVEAPVRAPRMRDG